MNHPSGTSPERAASTRQKFLEAGARVFVQEGYVRASMELVANSAGLSRAALYKHFRNKGELFTSVAEMLHESAAAASADLARTVSVQDDGAADLIVGFMDARRQRFRELLSSSAYATELMEESSRRCGPLIRQHAERFKSALVALIVTLADTGRLSLRKDISAAALADMLLASEAGLKSSVPTFLSSDFDVAFGRMAHTLLSGASNPKPSS